MPDAAKLMGFGVIRHDDIMSGIKPRYRGFLLNLKIPSVLRDLTEPSGKPNIKSLSSFFIAIIAIAVPEKNGSIANRLNNAGREYHLSSGHKIPAGIKKQEEKAHILAVINAMGLIGGVANMLMQRMITLAINRTRIIENAINAANIILLSIS
jgi:hypothetical protein